MREAGAFAAPYHGVPMIGAADPTRRPFRRDRAHHHAWTYHLVSARRSGLEAHFAAGTHFGRVAHCAGEPHSGQVDRRVSNLRAGQEARTMNGR